MVMKYAAKGRMGKILDLDTPTDELNEVTEELFRHAAAVIPWRLQLGQGRLQLGWMAKLAASGRGSSKVTSSLTKRQLAVRQQFTALNSEMADTPAGPS